MIIRTFVQIIRLCLIWSLKYMASPDKVAAPRFRVPNGVAPQRLRVALSPEMLERIKADAEKNMRTVSAMASLIIARHYQTHPED